ncbi:MAG: response regulator [Thermomicrobiales bacterium]|nr:response regulator [Thermomicrobiales bacterium]
MRILLVEDDPAIRSVLREFLSEEGFEVRGVADGRAGIHAARTIQPDLIVMDLMLPILDGVSATRQLKNDPVTRDIPIIAVSAACQARPRTREFPADDFVRKPFELEALLATISENLNHSSHLST